MKTLTIHSQDSCYVINQGQMDNDLQSKTAKSMTLEQGEYSIKIEKGWYSYSSGPEKGEPLVTLWIYGHDNAAFVNLNTGLEVGTTWTTLNGFNDVLALRIKPNQKATVCALFLDIDACQSRGGEVEISFTQIPSSVQKRLTIDSKKNCWKLNQNQLKSIRRHNSNFIDLEPGEYQIKVKEGNISYWQQQDEKFKLEPWAMLWVNGGKFITKYPEQGAENTVSESWCSLNGYQDKLNLKVLEKTTLFGLFFDTVKEDNQGQVVLAIEEVALSKPNQPQPAPPQEKPSQPVGNMSWPSIINDMAIWEMRDGKDIVCLTPVRTIVRREEEITLIRKVRKVEEIEASPACPINTNQISPPQQEP
ncbi:hypothetical protein ACL6C3_00435 [Capilliphycus salinus ALCB114379]|uniref:hypothetical protein n=1 Tax=Capilliphycus salinus TaxID=2768948 RepID=UPI0039A6E00D